MSLMVMLFATVMTSSVQAILPTWGAMGHAKPPLLLCVALYYALTRRRQVALAMAALLGFMQDAQGLSPIGVSLIPFFVIVLVVNAYREEVFILHPATHAIFGFFAALAVDFLTMLFLLALVPELQLGFIATMARILGTALCATAAFPLLYQALWHLDLALGNVEKRGAEWH